MHLSSVSVTAGQVVAEGQQIGLSGNTAPVSLGAHLHFEVWRNRESMDPLRYLTLSDIPFEELPSKYEEKFIDDIIEKS
jgi:murein DD-endopeptidase MepM/ murein hydrolase activator NlpD